MDSITWIRCILPGPVLCALDWEQNHCFRSRESTQHSRRNIGVKLCRIFCRSSQGILIYCYFVKPVVKHTFFSLLVQAYWGNYDDILVLLALLQRSDLELKAVMVTPADCELDAAVEVTAKVRVNFQLAACCLLRLLGQKYLLTPPTSSNHLILQNGINIEFHTPQSSTILIHFRFVTSLSRIRCWWCWIAATCRCSPGGSQPSTTNFPRYGASWPRKCFKWQIFTCKSLLKVTARERWVWKLELKWIKPMQHNNL